MPRYRSRQLSITDALPRAGYGKWPCESLKT
jgi:hypothetical protein